MKIISPKSKNLHGDFLAKIKKNNNNNNKENKK